MHVPHGNKDETYIASHLRFRDLSVCTLELSVLVRAGLCSSR